MLGSRPLGAGAIGAGPELPQQKKGRRKSPEEVERKKGDDE
jgi:hypothetical protein